MSLTEQQQRSLLFVARDSIIHGWQHGKPLPIELAAHAPQLVEVQACFVTLERHGQLRGCIGSLEANRPLVNDVAENAFASAFRDPRFPPLSESERSGLILAISVLSPPEALQFESEADLLNQLQPEYDGLILQVGHRRATFLPSVWRQLPESTDFLEHLKIKAGLPSRFWSDQVRAWRYHCQYFAMIFNQTNIDDPALP